MATELEARLRIVRDFPQLQTNPFDLTSDEDPFYNCIAWAMGEDTRFWWPVGGYWPPNVKRELTRASFLAAFKTKGFVPCEGPESEDGFEKIALFEKDGDPTHAARLTANGRWTSKLGPFHDISHSLEGLSAGYYGDPAVFLRRPIPQAL